MPPKSDLGPSGVAARLSQFHLLSDEQIRAVARANDRDGNSSLGASLSDGDDR